MSWEPWFKSITVNNKEYFVLKGIGLYLRHISKSEVRYRVQRMKDYGIKFAAIGAVWQKENDFVFINKPDMCKYIADQLMENGIDPLLWGYPYKGKHEEFVNIMSASSTRDIKCWILDCEKGMKDSNIDFALDSATCLFWECIKHNPYYRFVLSSYSRPFYHSTFPWESFIARGGFDPLREVDFAGPQLYDASIEDMIKAFDEYKEMGVDNFVPSFGGFKYEIDESGKKSYPLLTESELTLHLQNFLYLKRKYNIRAIIGWSENQISVGGWNAIKKFSNSF